MPLIRNPYTDTEEYVPEVQAEVVADPLAGYVTNTLEPEQYADFYALKDTNPDEYYNRITASIGDSIANNFRRNKSGRNDYLFQELEGIKEVNPKAYYNAQLRYLGEQLGWNHGQNTYEGTGAVQEQLKNLVPEAIKAGLSPQQIDSLVGSTFGSASAANQQRIATDAANGGSGFSFAKDILPGITFVGGAALGAAGPAALGLNAAQAAGFAAGTAGLSSAAKGASFQDILKNAAIGGALSYGLSGDTPFDSTSVALGGSGGGGNFVPSAGNSFSIDPSAAYTSVGSFSPFQGPTYGELGYTGVEGGFAGPTYQELGYTGLNQNEAIAAADAASKGLTGNDALDYINKAKKVYDNANKLSKLLKPSSGQGAEQAVTGGENTGLDIGKLASMLSAPQQTNSYIGQIKANETPFFGSNQGSLGGTNVYDVSGSNPMANALRKR